MARAGIEIGPHSYSHADLSRVIDPELLHRELAVARVNFPQPSAGRSAISPFPSACTNNLTCQAFAMAAQCGYEAVCSAYGGYNYPGDDPFHLQRIPSVCELLRVKKCCSPPIRGRSTRGVSIRLD